jgi:hypothetical protein
MRSPKTIITFALVLGLAAIPLTARAQRPQSDQTDLTDQTDNDGFPNAVVEWGCSYQRDFYAICSYGPRDQSMFITFTEPVRIPGHKILLPGSYRFLLSHWEANSNLIQIQDDRRHVVATLMTIPTERNNATEQNMVTLASGSGKAPDTLLKWFSSGDVNGHEFVYPGQEGKALSEEPVLTVGVAPADKQNPRKLIVSRQY